MSDTVALVVIVRAEWIERGLSEQAERIHHLSNGEVPEEVIDRLAKEAGADAVDRVASRLARRE